MFWVLILSLPFLSRCHQDCSSLCRKTTTTTLISGNKRLNCSSKLARDTPWSKANETTAPMPQNLTGDWFIHKNGKIALEIEWSQKAIHLTTKSVDGYYLKYTLTHIHNKRKYNEPGTKLELPITIEDDATSKKETTQGLVTFTYSCIGLLGTDLMPGHKYDVYLSALPLFRKDNNPQNINVKFTIPECEADERLTKARVASKECRAFWKGVNDAKTKTLAESSLEGATTAIVHELHTGLSVHFVLAPIAGILGISAIILIVLLIRAKCKEKTRGTMPTDHRAIAMVATESVCDIGVAHELASRLRDRFNLNVTCNWENNQAIVRSSCQWYYETIHNSTIVIFVFDHWEQRRSLEENNVPEEISGLMRRANSGTKELVILAIKDNRLPDTYPKLNMKLYDGGHSFWKLLRHLTGRKITKEMTLKKLLNSSSSKVTTKIPNDISTPLIGNSIGQDIYEHGTYTAGIPVQGVI